MAVSNVRPLAIFTGYMLLAAALTLKSVAIICGQKRRRVPPPPKNGTFAAAVGSPSPQIIFGFGFLAVFSLATTWYHMFRFFEWSYTQWAMVHAFHENVTAPGSDEKGLRLSEWLRNTSLFKQAWVSTLETGPRAWWSLQIFGFCANWSVLLAAQAKKRDIPHAWIFMLLGQVVAISFASNLSFLAILCSPVNDRKQHGKRSAQDASPSSLVSLHTIILVVTLLLATSVPTAIGKPGFLALLLGPHLLAFAPLLANKLLSPRFLGEPAWFWTAASMTWILATAFKGVWEEKQDMGAVLVTLYEHPAVSSVGWDVICCWISFGAWFFINLD
ncbi:hypothetical protein LZ31DRAFT_588169 [Colletotrichum somersetense]|nr:hypothetical protein LZ31DRAFT_588169 [Colletotrichum somersetense]